VTEAVDIEMVDMEMVDMEMVDMEMVLEVVEVKEIKACSLPSFVETAKADKEHKETVCEETFNIGGVQDSPFFCGVDEIQVEEKVDIKESFGFESLVDGRGRQYKRSLRNKKKMTNDICLELLGSESCSQLRRSLRTKHRKKPIYC
jgi:hypothetical protein